MTKEYGYGITGKVEQDEDAFSPREWDNMGTMVCWHRGHNLGDEQPKCSPDEYDLPDDVIKLPLYLYDHSGITMSTSPFSCPWDSGQVGFIYCEKGKEGMSDEAITKCLEGEVEEYDNYLTGNVWGYVIEDSQGEELDSCWGFIGDQEYCESEMDDIAKWNVEQVRIKLMEEMYEEVYG